MDNGIEKRMKKKAKNIEKENLNKTILKRLQQHPKNVSRWRLFNP